MIVTMKRVSIVMRTYEKTSTLKELRKVGIVHPDEVHVNTEKLEDLTHQYNSLHLALNTLKALEKEIQKKNKKKKISYKEILDEKSFFDTSNRLNWLMNSKEEKKQHNASLQKEIDFLLPFGDISLEDLSFLQQHGYPLYLYRVENKSLKTLEHDYILLSKEKKYTLIASVGESIDSLSSISLPPHSLSTASNMVEENNRIIAEIDKEIIENISHIPSFEYYSEVLESDTLFEEIQASMDDKEEDGIITWLSGYLPVTKEENFKQFAKEHSIGYALSDIKEDENPPTLVDNPKAIGIIKPVFDILGTVPGYREADISMWFLLFFSLFFAMIVGDGAYGLIFFLVAVLMHIKGKKATNANILLYVLSITSIVWGAVTGTWFGSKAIISSIPFLQALVIPHIASYPELFGLEATSAQNTVMQFCFIIGTVQLSLACVMNIYRKIGRKDLSAVADVGWLIMIDALYFLVLTLVINAPINMGIVGSVVGAGFFLIVVFGAQGPHISFVKGLLGGVGNLFTTFLNSISAFSNIISYIRLFAVGMASLAIAQSFNNMASGLLTGFALPAGIAVLVIGHGLNIIMALLSVVVHGVRLNLLEFSGQLGMEWTGYTYKPFKETVKNISNTL
jgi:V/A-type H+-transporting ATPase subunit I